jgi:Holliday junction resolvase RusA-like endonuclease
VRYWQGIIDMQPASKSNRRKLVTFGGRWVTHAGEKVRVGGRPALIKSDEARAFEEYVHRTVRPLVPLLQGRLRFTAKIFYRNELSDLDESVILDALQDRVYANDRQVREKHVFHGIDRDHPRCVIRVEEIDELPIPATVKAA